MALAALSSPAAEAILTEEGYDEVEVVVGYEPRTLSSLWVLFVVSGTIFKSRHLWLEQIFLVALYGSLYFSVHEHMVMCVKIDTLASLVQVVSTLAVFLLGFYTSNSLSRWWRLRTDGVGNIWAGSSELCMLISQTVTRDEQVLSAVRRYARASLMLQFMKHRKQMKNLDLLEKRDILTAEEVLCIKAYHNNLSESMWTWILNIVMNLHKDGLIQSDPILWKLIESVKKGRSGAALIGAQMGTPLPAQYVHILGFMVKLFNVFGAVAYGLKVGCKGTEIKTHLMLVFLPSLLYNSILIINAKLANPFKEHVLAFPMAKWDKTIESDGRSYVQAGDHLPRWLRRNGGLKKNGDIRVIQQQNAFED